MRNCSSGFVVALSLLCAKALGVVKGAVNPHAPADKANMRNNSRRLLLGVKALGSRLKSSCVMTTPLACDLAQVHRCGVQEIQLFRNELEFEESVSNVLLFFQDALRHRCGAKRCTTDVDLGDAPV